MGSQSVLVTGASGFIGHHLVNALLEQSGMDIRVLMRSAAPGDDRLSWPVSRVRIVAGDLTQPRSLAQLCDGIDTVYHLAGYAHADDSDDPEGHARHRQITVEGTRALLECAVAAGVKRFAFVSSVKAIGEGGETEWNEDSPALPTSGYGIAKREAESLVLAAGREHGLHAVVLRLPLVYGRDGKGNIARMIAAVDQGRFPPLPEVRNRRSMIHIDDVVRALTLVAADRRAGGQCFIVTDGQQHSTRELYDQVRQALGLPAVRWSVPVTLLRVAGRLGDWIGRVTGRPFVLDSLRLSKLLGSACYSSMKIQRELGFRPSRTLADGVTEMVEHYRRTSR